MSKRDEEDPLNALLCHTIRTCWKSLRGLAVLKGMDGAVRDVDKATKEGKAIDFSVRQKITDGWACGSSANVLSQLLTGDELKHYSGADASKDVILLSEQEKREKAIELMRYTSGYFMVRINVLAKGAGHAYVYLSQKRHSGEELKGWIYQTNVGCQGSAAFDLIRWIDDPKSATEVDLEQHLQNLVTGFNTNPERTYQQNYMLSGKEIGFKRIPVPEEVRFGGPAEEPSVLDDLKKLRRNVGGKDFCIQWRAVAESAASARLREILESAPEPIYAKQHKLVKPPASAVLTSR